MVELFLLIAVFLFCVLGICEFIHSLCIAFAAPKRKYHSFMVINLKKGKAVNQLGFAYEQRRWMGDLFAENIIGAYTEISDEELENCRNYAKQHNIHLVNLEYLGEFIRILEEKNKE